MLPDGHSATFVQNVCSQCAIGQITPDNRIAHVRVAAVVVEAGSRRCDVSAHGVVDQEERAAVVVDPGSCGCTVVTDLGIVDQHVAGASRTSAVVYAADVDTATEICCRISRDDGVGYGARSSVF